MGIQGLLPLLKSIHKPCNLKQFSGQTIGVDAYGWLHRGTVSCAVELALSKPTTKYVDFAMSRVRMLKHFGVTPYIIFDGDYLPSKSKTEKERSARRQESRKLGMQLLDMGKSSQAHLELQKAVDVTPEMAGLLIEELKRANIPYVVAPYEADSQMVFLEKKGIIQGILSEDSDLLVFGAKKLLTKLDQYGDCIMIRRDDFTACREVSLVGWSDREFRQMAIMSGCDYLNGIEKMGLKTAHRFMRSHKTIDRIVRAIQFDGKHKVPKGYLEAFAQAELTFLHQWVYCPNTKQLVHLTPLEDGVRCIDLPFIGEYVEPSLAAKVARGEIHPHTKEPLRLPNVANKRMAPLYRRQAVTETPDMKKHQSIDSFFKPKRTPLAELDPNMFAASPSQEHLIRRASGSSWPAMPVEATPTPVLARSSTMPASAPMVSRRPLSDTSIAISRVTNTDRATKRKRLCTDGSSPVADKDATRIEHGKSRFFGGSLTPSKKSKGGSRKTDDFQLWSDDFEDALRELPLPGVASASVRKLPVFNDALHLSQSTMNKAPRTIANSTSVAGAANIASNVSRSSRKSDPNRLDASLRAEVQSLHERFNSTATTKIIKRRESAANVTDSRKLESEGKPTISTICAVEKPRDVEEPDISDEQRSNTECKMVIPDSDTVEPFPSPSPRSTGQGIVGSEDLLVSESDMEGSDGGTPKAVPVLDLGRFAFRA